MNKRKLLRKALSGSKNLRFGDMVVLVEAFGFRLDRTNGSHHILVHDGVRELINLQNLRGKAKPYQVRQLLDLVELHDLQMEDGA